MSVIEQDDQAIPFFLREAPDKTLSDVREMFEIKTETIACRNSDIKVNLTDEPRITFGNDEGEGGKVFTVPVSPSTLTVISDWIGAPPKFVLKQDLEFQEFVLTHLLNVNPAPVAVTFTEGGIESLRAPTVDIIDPRYVVDIASRVIDPSATVVDAWKTPREYRFDVIAPEGFDRGIGGDPRVGDITRGGLRFGQDLQHGLSPWVQPYMYRLVCTNGQETFDPGLKIEGRGKSVDDVLMELELAAQRAFGRIEREIEAFYSLRSVPVDNPERILFRLREETNIPPGLVDDLAEIAPAFGNDVTMFDMVNIITNQANDPTIERKAPIRRRIEQTGGYVIRGADHARCATCKTLLDHASHN